MRWDWTDWVGIAVLLFLVCIVSLGVVSGIAEAERRKVLLGQCLDDGRKEYECESMLRRPRVSTVPIIVGR